MILTILDISMVIETALEETGSKVHAKSKINIIWEVETETRSDEHRVNKRVEGVTTVILQAHFAREFHERSHPGSGVPVQARAIDERLSQAIASRRNIACRQVPHNRSTDLVEVERECETRSKSPPISSKWMRIAATIQIPGMAGTHTGAFFTRRNIEVKHQGHAIDASRCKRETDLCKDIQVTAASRPHICHSTPLGIGMFIIKRK